MTTVSQKIDSLLKEAVEKDLACINKYIESYRNINEITSLDTHFYDFESLTTFFDDLKKFLHSYEHIIPRIEGVHSYEEDKRQLSLLGYYRGEGYLNDHIWIPIHGGGDGVYDWSHIFQNCAKNTLELIKKLGGKVIMTDNGGEWTYG